MHFWIEIFPCNKDIKSVTDTLWYGVIHDGDKDNRVIKTTANYSIGNAACGATAIIEDLLEEARKKEKDEGFCIVQIYERAKPYGDLRLKETVGRFLNRSKAQDYVINNNIDYAVIVPITEPKQSSK